MKLAKVVAFVVVAVNVAATAVDEHFQDETLFICSKVLFMRNNIFALSSFHCQLFCSVPISECREIFISDKMIIFIMIVKE